MHHWHGCYVAEMDGKISINCFLSSSDVFTRCTVTIWCSICKAVLTWHGSVAWAKIKKNVEPCTLQPLPWGLYRLVFAVINDTCKVAKHLVPLSFMPVQKLWATESPSIWAMLTTEQNTWYFYIQFWNIKDPISQAENCQAAFLDILQLYVN